MSLVKSGGPAGRASVRSRARRTRSARCRHHCERLGMRTGSGVHPHSHRCMRCIPSSPGSGSACPPTTLARSPSPWRLLPPLPPPCRGGYPLRRRSRRAGHRTRSRTTCRRHPRRSRGCSTAGRRRRTRTTGRLRPPRSSSTTSDNAHSASHTPRHPGSACTRTRPPSTTAATARPWAATTGPCCSTGPANLCSSSTS